MTLLRKALIPPNITVAGTSLSLTPAHLGTSIDFTSASAITLTIPTDASAGGFGDNFSAIISQQGTGPITIVGASNSVKLLTSAYRGFTTDGKYSTLVIRRRSADVWIISGETVGTPKFMEDLGVLYDAQTIRRSMWPAKYYPALTKAKSNLATSTVSGAWPGLNSNWASSGLTATSGATGFKNLTASFTEKAVDGGFTVFAVTQLRLSGSDAYILDTGSSTWPLVMSSAGLATSRTTSDVRTVISAATLTGAGFTDSQPAVIVMAQDTASGSRLDRGLVYGNGVSVTGSSATTLLPTYSGITLSDFTRPIAAFGIYRRSLTNGEMLTLATDLATKWRI